MSDLPPEGQEYLKDFPPLAPGDEPPADDPDLKRAALEVLRDSHILATATTLNESFGTVVRVDHHTAESEYPFRLFCWRKPDGSAGTLVCTSTMRVSRCRHSKCRVLPR